MLFLKRKIYNSKCTQHENFFFFSIFFNLIQNILIHCLNKRKSEHTHMLKYLLPNLHFDLNFN